MLYFNHHVISLSEMNRPFLLLLLSFQLLSSVVTCAQPNTENSCTSQTTTKHLLCKRSFNENTRNLTESTPSEHSVKRRKRSVTSAVADYDEYATNIGTMMGGHATNEMIDKRDHVARFGAPRTSRHKKGGYMKPRCWKKCHPGSFQECAIPRCQVKRGVIRRLCFLLCQQQEEHCVETCAW